MVLKSDCDYLLEEILRDCREFNKTEDDFIYLERSWKSKNIINYSFDPIDAPHERTKVKFAIGKLNLLNTHKPSILGAFRHFSRCLDRKVDNWEKNDGYILKKLKREMYESKIKIVIKKVKKRNKKRNKMRPSKLIDYFDISSIDELDELMDYMENNQDSENVKALQEALDCIEIIEDGEIDE